MHITLLYVKYLRKGYLQASREYFSCLPYVWRIYLYKKNFSHHNSKKQIKKIAQSGKADGAIQIYKTPSMRKKDRAFLLPDSTDMNLHPLVTEDAFHSFPYGHLFDTRNL